MYKNSIELILVLALLYSCITNSNNNKNLGGVSAIKTNYDSIKIREKDDAKYMQNRIKEIVEEPPEIKPENIIEPSFPGGEKEFLKYIQKNSKIPISILDPNDDSDENDVCIVGVDFEIDTNGRAINLKIGYKNNASNNALCEAKRLIKNTPLWDPAYSTFDKNKKINWRVYKEIKFIKHVRD